MNNKEKTNDMIDEKQFDELWERAEAGRYAAGLSAEYPAWRTRRRRTAGVVAGLALVLAVASPLMLQHSRQDSVAKVYSNRAGSADQQWLDLADGLLMKA